MRSFYPTVSFHVSEDVSHLWNIAGQVLEVVTKKHPFVCILEVVSLIYSIKSCDASETIYSSEADKELMIKVASEHHQILI